MSSSEKNDLLGPRDHQPPPSYQATQHTELPSDDKKFVIEHEAGRSAEDGVSGSGCCAACVARLYPGDVRRNIRGMLTVLWPIVLTQISQMIIGPISLIFCGHLGDKIQLDGAALAMSMINATCIAIGQGLGTSCDTFFSQSFGSKNKKNVGIYLQRSVYIFLLAVFPCWALHLNMESFLLLIGQHPAVARLCGRYMIIFMPGTLSFFMYIVLAKFMQNQNIVLPNVVIGLVSNAVNAVLHYVFLYQLGWNTDGSAVAQSVAYFVMFLLTLLYVIFSKCYVDAWPGWTVEGLQEWGRFVRLAVPGMLMLCLEWWGFEIGVFLTGILGTTELGAQAVLLQLDSIWFQIPLGIQIVCAIRVGQYLGAGRPTEAKTTARLAITIIGGLSLVAVAVFIGLQYQLPYLFTNVHDVALLTSQLLPIVVIYIFFDGIATACKGVLYGTGRQKYGAFLLFLSYYVLALPVGIPLMFLTALRTAAYWICLAFNLVLQAVALVVIVTRTDWEAQVIKAQERAGLMGELNDDDDDSLDTTSQTVLMTRGRRRSRLASASLTYTQVKAVVASSERLSARALLCRRLPVICLMLAVLGAGIALRILLEIEDPFIQRGTSTVSPENYTESYDVSVVYYTDSYDVSTVL